MAEKRYEQVRDICKYKKREIIKSVLCCINRIKRIVNVRKNKSTGGRNIWGIGGT